MKCLEDIQLLMFLEGELSESEDNEILEHLELCSICRRRRDDIQKDLELIQKSISSLNEDGKTARVWGQEPTWQNIKARSFGSRKEGNVMKMKKFMAAAVILIAVFATASIPTVQVLASNILQAFRVQQVDVVTISPADMSQIERAIMRGDESFDLDQYGKIDIIGNSISKSIRQDELAELSFTPILPRDESVNQYYMEKIAAIEITPKVDNLNALLKAVGSEYFLPSDLDGQTFRISIGDSLRIENENYQLVQGPAPVIEVPSGIKVSEVAQAMVGLPIWPEDVKRQLEAVSDWEHTLLIPAHEGAKKVKVRGQDGVYLEENRSQLLIWEDNEILYFLSSDSHADLLAIAESLR
jgi:hypothetical protein